MTAPAAPAGDPNIAPYPRRDEVARLRGTAPFEQPVPLDITGVADLQEQVHSISDLLSKGSVPDGGLQWDADSKKVIVRLVGSVDGTSAPVEALKTSVLARAAGLIAKGFAVEFRSVKYSQAELEQLSTQLFSTTNQWAPGLTGAAGGFDVEKNRVVVLIPDATSQAWTDRVRALKDDRITTQTYVPTPGDRVDRGADGLRSLAPAASRINDFQDAYAGGDWLSDDGYLTASTTGNADCTGGYIWRKWTTNVRYGSTANHCEEGNKYWYNNKQPFGAVTPTTAFTSPASDTLLMSWPSSGAAYAGGVYVGNQSTMDYRLVAGIQSSFAVGDSVALSGANTGLHTAKIKIVNFKDNGYTYVLMNTRQAAGGDSGGPWLTTCSQNSNCWGDAIAHGQHHGYGPPGTEYYGDEFVPVNYISQKLSASIVLN